MKFLHAADLHLAGHAKGLREFYGETPPSIAAEIKKSFIKLIDFALEKSVDFILFPGDIFDSNWKDFSLGLFFIQQLNRVSCPVYYIRGNHDAENRLFKKLPYPKHLYEFPSDEPTTYIHEELKIAVHGQSYASFKMTQDLSLSYPPALPGYFNIGLLHTSGENQSDTKPYAPFSLQKVLEKKYDYWAFGHLHDFQVIHTHPHLVYSGNIQGRHINEQGQKGCVLTHVVNENVEVEFCPLSSLEWLQVDLEVSDLPTEEELKDALLCSIQDKIKTKSRVIVRILLKGITQQKEFFKDTEEGVDYRIHCWLKEAFGDKVYLEKVVRDLKFLENIEALNESATLFQSLLKDISDSVLDENTGQFISTLLERLKEKAPGAYLGPDQHLEVENLISKADFSKKIEGKIYRYFLEES